MEDYDMFYADLSAYFAGNGGLESWRLIEVRYPELLADWLTAHADYCPPPELGIRIGKRPEHFQGGRRNL